MPIAPGARLLALACLILTLPEAALAQDAGATADSASTVAAPRDEDEPAAPEPEAANSELPEPAPVDDPAAEAAPVDPDAPLPAPTVAQEPAAQDSAAERMTAVAAPASDEPSAAVEPVAVPVPPHGSVGPPELVAEADPASSAFIGPRQMDSFRILGQDVLPGGKARLEWSASQSFAGSEVISPVVVAHGVRPGAVLCLVAAVHGDELNGVEIVRRLTRRIDPEALNGTVIAVPIVNLFGFSRNSRYLPDRRDLNRFFPGTQGGSIASRIAHSFFSNVVRHCEVLVDFHTGSFDRSNLPQVRADLRLPEVLRFARGFGAVPVLHSNGNRGMLRVAATQAGIPAVTFEVGAPAILQPAEINAGVRAIEALMHHLGLIPIAPGEQEPQAIFYDSMWVRANAGGMLITEVELGQRVVPGQRLGWVVDPVNDIEREIAAPLYGRVIGMARNQVVLPGFAAFHLGEETSEARAVHEAASGRREDPVEEDPDPALLDNGREGSEPTED
jgi:uncharacterized protein